jgi:hypothetical protein
MVVGPDVGARETYCKSGKLPKDLHKDNGWDNWGDWLRAYPKIS